MGHDPPQRRQRTVISFRDVMISGPFSQSEDGELQIEGLLEGDLTCHALIVPSGGTVKGTIRADWVVIQGNFCGNVETSVFTATKDAVVIGGRITVYEKVLIEPGCLFRGELQRPGEGDGTPARGFARSAAVEESDRLAAETMASWSFSEGDTALVEAIGKGDGRIVGRLLLAGADPNAATPEGMTALTLAAGGLRIEIAEMLLGAGADPDLRTAEGETPLLLASDRGALRLVEALLAAGADPSAARADGSTPLIEAARRGRTEIVRALLLAGADLEERNAAGEMPMLLAKARGYKETLALLRQAAVGDLAPAADAEGEVAAAAPSETEAAAAGPRAEPAKVPAEPAIAEGEAPPEPEPPATVVPAKAETETDVPGAAEAATEATIEAGGRSEGGRSEDEGLAPSGPGPSGAGSVPASPAEMAAADADPPPPRRPALRLRIPPKPKESAESVLADLAPAPAPAAPAPAPPLRAPQGEASEPASRIETGDEAASETTPPAGAAEPVPDLPKRNGAGGAMPPPEADPQIPSEPREAPSPAPYLRMPQAAEAPPPPAPAACAEARPDARVLAPEEVEDLSRQVASLILPFSLEEARAPLPAGEAEGWRLAPRGEGLAASATRPVPAGPGSREAVLVKYGSGGGPPGQIELRLRGTNGAGDRGDPQTEGELRLSLFDPDESLVYWPVGFRRVVLRAGERAGAYACDEDGNWSRSDEPAEH